MALMESAIQASRESPGNLEPQEFLVNAAPQGYRGSVMFPCAINLTTSGRIISAKDPTSDDKAAKERLLLAKTS